MPDNPAGTPQEPNEGAGGNPQQPPTQASTTPAASTTPPRSVPGGLIVDQGQWEQMNNELATVRAEREKREQREDQDFLAKAARGGKIPVNRIDHYMTLMKADREGTRQFIERAGRRAVPVTRDWQRLANWTKLSRRRTIDEQLAHLLQERRRVKTAARTCVLRKVTSAMSSRAPLSERPDLCPSNECHPVLRVC
jgi:hypothetical protein